MELTIYFDGQYWSGLVKYQDTEGRLRVHRHVFGAEPNDQEVYRFVYEQLPEIIETDWHGTITLEEQGNRKISPKRMQRMLQRQKSKPILSTKAQLAMAEQREAQKQERKHKSRDKKLEKKQLVFEKKQQKRLEKRKGH
ncbi:YjdF family protein [Enterococcus sp. BWR-S5]|uniref:YjdF family protein n=1 Tax=Enterococcus sp. BWR-S5 TaxID=2787714 RepID=UPI001924DB27|nr:YjdF family protein [Enterococcus sp. BWR-S5]MBL1223944.1 YjdF family protein [Enterococcus sp. BWR-S5]